MTTLYASGLTRMSAVSSTCTSRKKKIATPVIRCNTQDHMPSAPRYRVPPGVRRFFGAEGATWVAWADTSILLGSGCTDCTVSEYEVHRGHTPALQRETSCASIMALFRFRFLPSPFHHT